MLKRLRDLQNWTVVGRDGEDVGSISDFYLDDERWVLRFFLINAGGWMVDHPVFVSPLAITKVNWEDSTLEVDLTRDQVRKAPRLDPATSQVTRWFESDYYLYYGYPFYWDGPHAWGAQPLPTRVAGAAAGAEPVPAADGSSEGTLHSVDQITGYHLQALDGEIGHVEDFLVDPESWSIRYLVIDTSNWIGGRTVLVSPEWVRRIDWNDRLFHVDLTRDAIKDSPQYDPTIELDREYETRLYAYYRRPAYWK